jgi:hypothetical protein
MPQLPDDRAGNPSDRHQLPARYPVNAPDENQLKQN